MLSQTAITKVDEMTPGEVQALLQVHLNLHKLTRQDLVPAMARHGFRSDLIPANLTDAEAQLIYGCRFLEVAGFGKMDLCFHEKKRVSYTLSIHGR